jgi:hypothetical protein
MVQASNPSYLEGRGRKIACSMPAMAKLIRPSPKNNKSKQKE